MRKENDGAKVDLVCFSHLRWDSVDQRPQHLMSRFARQRRVYFIEEPLFGDRSNPQILLKSHDKSGVIVATPSLPRALEQTDAKSIAARNRTVSRLITGLLRDANVKEYVSWFYTPMALEYFPSVEPSVTVYDCMDELSSYKGAPPTLCSNEKELFRRCDIVFTGGTSLFEAKRRQHSHVYPFPSSVDAAHFAQARNLPDTARDQSGLPRPRLGYAGVIDERIDLALIRQIAQLRPEWQFIMVGPVVKIDEAMLPQLPNIHWLGKKEYQDLPQYFAGWDVAIMPFATNDATRHISPTKALEYLAAGLPVVSTAIHDVVRAYGQLGMARIATNPQDFVGAAEHALMHGVCLKTRKRIDNYVRASSWEHTWSAMDRLIEGVISAKQRDREAVPAPLLASHAGAASF